MLLWSTDVTGPEYLPVFEMLLDAGYEGVEIPIFDTSPGVRESYERLGEQLQAMGLERLGVGARGGEDSPISPDPAVRERGLQATNAAVDICAALGAKAICGPLGAPLGTFSGSGPTAEEKQWAVESLRAAAEHAATRDVTIVVEYLNRFEMYLINCAADAAALVREVDHPNCKLMYDTFHAHIEEKDPAAALRECQDVLVHFHASENDRGTPGSGQVAWDETFAALKEIGYDDWIVIEAFGGSLPDLAAATKIWRPMFESEEQLARDGAAFLRERWSNVAA
ncbi:MAG: D-psicose/D-tagatose/L-ribulose 3-epimerase [Gaiellaceae bacterium]|nr:D-psicose/D-tagatose/L-ribulose 3-epimerase [Gaiellaceae bacterium]